MGPQAAGDLDPAVRNALGKLRALPPARQRDRVAAFRDAAPRCDRNLGKVLMPPAP